MTYKGDLFKGDYVIRVWSNTAGAYKIEFSNDGFKSKQSKTYNSRYEFLQAMETRFLPEELKPFLED